MEIRLFMNDYLDIYLDQEGKVQVEIGKINKDGEGVSENSYANSSFATYMKYLGIDVQDLESKISKYISENELFIRIKRNNMNTGLEYNLYDISTRKNLVSYSSFDELVETEVLQKEINVSL